MTQSHYVETVINDLQILKNSDNGKIQIPVWTSRIFPNFLPIWLFLTPPMVLMTSTMTQTSSTVKTYIESDLVKQELGKNDAENNKFKNWINKNLAEKRFHKRVEGEILNKNLQFSKKKTSVLLPIKS